MTVPRLKLCLHPNDNQYPNQVWLFATCIILWGVIRYESDGTELVSYSPSEVAVVGPATQGWLALSVAKCCRQPEEPSGQGWPCSEIIFLLRCIEETYSSLLGYTPQSFRCITMPRALPEPERYQGLGASLACAAMSLSAPRSWAPPWLAQRSFARVYSIVLAESMPQCSRYT